MSTKMHCKQDMMTRIEEVRFTQPEEERALCLELLSWAEAREDRYATAFAHVFLGDYFIGQNNSECAAQHLLAVKELVTDAAEFDAIKMRRSNLMAICCEMQGDEQGSTGHYLETLRLSRAAGDVNTECISLNNIAFVFHRNKKYDEALRFYEQAYRLNAELPQNNMSMVLLSNLAEISIRLGHMEEARAYLELCEKTQQDVGNNDCSLICNRCLYSVAAEDAAEVLRWGEAAVEKTEQFLTDPFSAFEKFSILFTCMLYIGHRAYAAHFLRLMEQVMESTNLRDHVEYEEFLLRYARAFCTPEEQRGAYRRFYQKTQELNAKANQVIANAMLSLMELDSALQKNEQMDRQRTILEQQANMDDLTLLYNRYYLDSALAARAEDTEKSLAVLMIDVDFFKEYNDFYGHIKGDEALRAVAQALWSCRGDSVYPCRFGGDEFTCICDGLSRAEVEAYIRAVRAELKKKAIPHEKSNCSDRVTLSIGYAFEAGPRKAIPLRLLDLADKALYKAKLAGRNTFSGKEVTTP